jgi:uncharacterized protein YbaR (Trm112 family)
MTDFPEDYNKCKFCGNLIEKPKVFCDETCRRAYDIKQKIPNVEPFKLYPVSSKARLKLIFNVADMLKKGVDMHHIQSNLSLWFTQRTVDEYIRFALKINELERGVHG